MLTPITSKEFSMLSMGNASNPLCNTGSLRLPGARQQNQKLGPAKSADIVASAQLAGHQRGDAGKHLVAKVVAVLIVKVLKVIYVNQNHAERIEILFAIFAIQNRLKSPDSFG